jgi:Ca-activated chloride channel homolog
MSGLGDIALLRPVWLLALPALAGFALLLWRRQRGAGDWARVIDPALLAALRAMGRIERAGPGAAGLAALLVAGLTALALSGPSVERRDAAAFRNLDGVVFVLDASPSATGGADWEGLRTMGRSGIAALGSRPGALVVFAGDAYVASDMTADTRQVGLTLSLVEPGTVPDPGSRPERGLRLAAEILEEAEVLAGDVVLLTDGGGVGPGVYEAAGAIAGQGARLSVVGPDPSVAPLAEIGRGQFFALDEGNALAAFLGEDARQRLERQDYPLLFRADLGRYLLALALLPALLLFRRPAE